MIELDRRTLLGLGLGTLVLGATGCSRAAAPTVPPAQTYAQWAARRHAPYFVAHRGAGTTIPEHSLPGYQKAMEWGAEALELSVVISSDGVLYCHHDLTLDRTTTLTGSTASTPSSAFDRGRISIPRLGPRWTGSGMPAIPRLTAALDAVGRKILCMEAKDDAAYEPIMKLLSQRGLLPQVMMKLGYTSSRIEQAKAAGLPVFAYFGTVDTVTDQNLSVLAAKLDPMDAIVLPARAVSLDLIPEPVVRKAVATGIPVWVYPVHRRSEVDYFTGLGVSGIVTPALGYLSGSIGTATRDSFSTRSLAPGLTTRDPYTDWDAVGWDTADAIELIGAGARSVCMGDLSPVASASTSWSVALDVAMTAGPMAASDAFYFAFGCPDDRYFQSGGPGYVLSLRQDGLMQLFASDQTGTRKDLGNPTRTAALTKGVWTRLTVQVDPEKVTISRDGGDPVTFSDSHYRGGYLHVGRTQGVAHLAVRNVVVQS